MNILKNVICRPVCLLPEDDDDDDNVDDHDGGLGLAFLASLMSDARPMTAPPTNFVPPPGAAAADNSGSGAMVAQAFSVRVAEGGERVYF